MVLFFYTIVFTSNGIHTHAHVCTYTPMCTHIHKDSLANTHTNRDAHIYMCIFVDKHQHVYIFFIYSRKYKYKCLSFLFFSKHHLIWSSLSLFHFLSLFLPLSLYICIYRGRGREWEREIERERERGEEVCEREICARLHTYIDLYHPRSKNKPRKSVGFHINSNDFIRQFYRIK